MSISSTNLSAQLKGGLKGPSMTIWLCAAAVWFFIVWASFAWVDEIARAEGEIISSSKPQIIQNLEGGILTELLVKEGDLVRRGDVLARLHGTQFRSSVDDLQDQVTALEIRRLRLEAELAGESTFEVPSALSVRSPLIMSSEQSLLSARQSDYFSRREGAKTVMMQSAAELKILEDLLPKKVVSLIEVTRARKAYADAKIKYDETVTQTELMQAQEYSDTLKEIATLQQTLKSSEDQLNRTVVTSPMDGVVNDLTISTIGGVVRPGEQIMQITPADEEMYVEALVKPKDIANIRPGQEATIKLSAYDYTIYGSLKGRVHIVSADTFKDERRPEEEPHYKVSLKVDLETLTERQSQIDIRPGMLASVELHTGEKTILQYLLKPLYKSREAFHEP